MYKLFKAVIYKSYVLLLIAFVFWVAQFIYPLIFWEFEHTGRVSEKVLVGDESDLERMQKLRTHLDSNRKITKVDLSNKKFEEEYVDNHFHHIGARMDAPVISGCDYCHNTLPHQKDEEIRAFLNMHNYFMACETCHYDAKDQKDDIAYRWVKNGSLDPVKRPLALLKDKTVTGVDNDIIRGRYDARIIPWSIKSDDALSIIELSDVDDAKDTLEDGPGMDKQELDSVLDKMHKTVTDKPLECDSCHSEKNTAISYEDLGYPVIRAKQLMDTAIVGMISKYKQFHFPNLFIRKEDRQKDFESE